MHFPENARKCAHFLAKLNERPLPARVTFISVIICNVFIENVNLFSKYLTIIMLSQKLVELKPNTPPPPSRSLIRFHFGIQIFQKEVTLGVSVPPPPLSYEVGTPLEMLARSPLWGHSITRTVGQ